MSKQQKKDHRKASLTRRQGVREIKQSFLIVCEGEKTEPDYFKAFRMTAATVKNADAVLAQISHGNPANEESSTTVQKLVKELNKYL